MCGRKHCRIWSRTRCRHDGVEKTAAFSGKNKICDFQNEAQAVVSHVVFDFVGVGLGVGGVGRLGNNATTGANLVVLDLSIVLMSGQIGLYRLVTALMV